MAPSLDLDDERGARALGWTQVLITVFGAIGAAAVPALMWAGSTATEVSTLKMQRATDRQETRDDMKGVRDDVRELNRKVDMVLERLGNRRSP